VAAPFLMTLLRDLVTDVMVFATCFTDNVVLEAMECADSEDQDEQRCYSLTVTVDQLGRLVSL
jgi:hypothetical protein